MQERRRFVPKSGSLKRVKIVCDDGVWWEGENIPIETNKTRVNRILRRG